jgi:hypothetical protein
VLPPFLLYRQGNKEGKVKNVAKLVELIINQDESWALRLALIRIPHALSFANLMFLGDGFVWISVLKMENAY